MGSSPLGCRAVVNWLASLLMALSLVCAAHAQQPVTERSAVAALDKMKQTYEVRNFRIGGKYDLANPRAWENGGEGGTTLESLGAGPARTAYIAVGTPKKNDKGEIINAIVISTFFSGDATSMYSSWYAGQPGNAFSGGALVGPGLMFDTNRFYVVFLDGLGLWGASKPSDGLARKFPVYSYYDMVQLNYRLLRDHLKIGQVVLATGVSMGGTQSYYWGLMYPDFVKAVMPIGGASATDGPGGQIAAWTFQLAKASLESDPVWIETKADYYKLPKDKHPNQGVEFHWSQLLLTGFDLNFRQSLGWDEVSKEVFAWKEDPRLGKNIGVTLKRMASQFDAVDLWYRDTVGELHNVNKLLPGMKARTLVAHVDNDLWLMGSDARKASETIPGGLYAGFSDPIAHYAVFKAPNVLKNNQTFSAFMRSTGIMNQAEQGIVCEAKNYRRPRINMNPDPKKSFWKDEMVSPFPVKYANAKDRKRHRLADRLYGRVLRQAEQPADPGHRPRQGRLRRALRQPHQVRRRTGLPRHRARHAAGRHLRPGQSRQAAGTHAGRHPRRLPFTGGRQAGRTESLLLRPLAGWADGARLCIALPECGAGPDSRRPGRS